jgi:hypothetical protein
MTPREVADRLRHDLGKAIVLSRRWLADGASEAELRAALRDDLLRTRRGPDGVVSAFEVWAARRGEVLVVFPDHDAVRVIDAAMEALSAERATLDGAGPVAADVLARVAERTDAVEGACRALVDAARGGR